jgi:hypothetical protein
MKGDFSRNTFDKRHHYARVLMQQGRVLLDADWNEQTAILLHYLRTLAADLIGPHGGPGEGFRIICNDDYSFDFQIGRGHYYVDGILCDNDVSRPCQPTGDEQPLTYTSQPDFPLLEQDEARLMIGDYLVYLDVWERHLNHLQADHIRELALGGPDTATRAQVVCQVKAVVIPDDYQGERACQALVNNLLGRQSPCLRARARVENPSDEPCLIPPEARYRGAENQLYRIEIHRGTSPDAPSGSETFKWSRDNGSVVFGIRSLQGSTVTLDSLGPDGQRNLNEDDWVEIVDDFSVLRFTPRNLLRVMAVDRVNYTLTLDVPDGMALPVFDQTSTTHPLLRRWDQDSDAMPVEPAKWIELEDGVQIYFEPGATYRNGDYWLLPARTATGDLLWPSETGPDGNRRPMAVPPLGIEHHHAPLAIIAVDANGVVSCEHPCHCRFNPLCSTSALSLNENIAHANIRYPVHAIDGVGETFALRLGAADIIEATELVRHDAEDLARIMAPSSDRPIPLERVERIIENARRYIETVDREEPE